MLLFAVSVSALLFFTYWNTRRTLDAQTDQIIEAEITGLSEQYQRLGLRGLAESVMSRSLHGSQALYLLTDSQHRLLAGNLDTWPVDHRQSPAISSNSIMSGASMACRKPAARAAAFSRLAGNFYLLVAQDVHDRDLTQRMFTTTLALDGGADPAVRPSGRRPDEPQHAAGAWMPSTAPRARSWPAI